MTIITKSVSEKKLDKLEEPLVQNEVNEASVPPKKDVEVELPVHMYQPLHARARRINTATTLCACITAILVLTVGVIGGVYLYKQLSRPQMHRFRAWCNVPKSKSAVEELGSASALNRKPYTSHPKMDNSMSSRLFFQEGFEIGITYEQIVVPDFTGSRRSRFIHDFSTNKTGIIDVDGRRCFVMALNRSHLLPPQSLYDLVLKMKAGYYEVDTEEVRETMRVVYPPINDYKSLGYYIARECASLKTFMLERVAMPRHRAWFAKRSVESSKHLRFTEFAGRGIVYLDIVGVEELQSYGEK